MHFHAQTASWWLFRILAKLDPCGRLSYIAASSLNMNTIGHVLYSPWWLIKKCVIFTVSISYMFIFDLEWPLEVKSRLPYIEMADNFSFSLSKSKMFAFKMSLRTPGTLLKKNKCSLDSVYFMDFLGQTNFRLKSMKTK